MSDEPSALLLFVMGLGAVGLMIFLLWLNHTIVTRRRPKSEEEEEHTPAQATPPAPTLTDRIMSRLLGSAGPIEGDATRLHTTPHEGVQGVANTRKSVNEGLRPQGVAQPVIPEEARDIIQFWTKIEDTERVIKSGKLGTVEAIELIFECKRNGRPDSVYGRARAALQARSEATYRANQARLVELQATAMVEE